MRAKSRTKLGFIFVFLVLTLTLSLTLPVYQVHAVIPQKINYQGYLINAAGVPYQGHSRYNSSFTIFK